MMPCIKHKVGSVQKHSTETALTFMTENWLHAINDDKIVGTIVVDFRKAFDLVDHGLRGLFGKFVEFGHKMFKYRSTTFML